MNMNTGRTVIIEYISPGCLSRVGICVCVCDAFLRCTCWLSLTNHCLYSDLKVDWTPGCYTALACLLGCIFVISFFVNGRLSYPCLLRARLTGRTLWRRYGCCAWSSGASKDTTLPPSTHTRTHNAQAVSSVAFGLARESLTCMSENLLTAFWNPLKFGSYIFFCFLSQGSHTNQVLLASQFYHSAQPGPTKHIFWKTQFLDRIKPIYQASWR